MYNKTKSALMFLLLVAISASAWAQEAPDEAELRAMLDQFLEGASAGDAQTHENFWGEELIYTSSSGTRFGKADIMAGFDQSDEEEDSGDSGSTRYWAEEVQVQQHGDMAIVAFRLMGEIRSPGAPEAELSEYFNTGTFLKRDGQWRVVAWQATRIPAE